MMKLRNYRPQPDDLQSPALLPLNSEPAYLPDNSELLNLNQRSTTFPSFLFFVGFFYGMGRGPCGDGVLQNDFHHTKKLIQPDGRKIMIFYGIGKDFEF